MKVIYSQRFLIELGRIVKFIARDSKIRAKEFSRFIKQTCQNLTTNPYKCRKSPKFNSDNVRDLIIKGFVIPYLVSESCIIILGIYKENAWEA